MAQQDNRSRPRGGDQQEAYGSPSRQQGGGYDSPRQPQGDHGRGRDEAWRDVADWRREQRDFGGYRDEGNPYGSRNQDDRYGHGDSAPYRGDAPRYGQYGLRDHDEDRHGPLGGYGQDQRERSNRPSGLDRDYRGAGYAGPGGYGGGYGGSYSGSPSGYSGQRDQPEQQFDPDYSQWRREQMRALDDDYNQWRQDRFKKFSDEFSTWRSSRQQAAGTGKSEGGSPSSGKQNKDNS